MNRLVNFVFASIFLILIQGCVTPIKPLPPSEFLLYTDRPQTEVLGDIRNRLKENNYEIARFDYVTGLISTKPRIFSFGSKFGSSKGEQIIMIRQEAGSIKLRLQYRCQYPKAYSHPADAEVWGVCELDDPGTIDKIEKLENIFLPVFADTLNKKTAGADKSKQTLRSQVRRYR